MKLLHLFQILALLTFVYGGGNLIIQTSSPDQVRSLFSNTTKSAQNNSLLLNLQGDFTVHDKKVDRFSGLLSDTEIYLRIRAADLEFIICERDEKTKQSSIATWLFLKQNDDLKEEFISKAFVVKVGNRFCQGKIYYTKEDATAIQNINSLVQEVFTSQTPLSFANYLKSFNKETLAHIKIVTGQDSIVKVSYDILNLPFAFLAQNKQWEKVENAGQEYKLLHNKEETKVKIVNTVGDNKTHANALTILQGAGLHQKITKTLFIEGNKNEKISFAKNKNCKILLVDSLTDQTYVDQDEIRYTNYLKLKRFDVLDIEKPTETARQHLWIIQMDIADLTQRSGNDNELNVEYPVHFRYRNPGPDVYADSQLFLRTKLFSNCNLTNAGDNASTGNDFYGEKVRELYGKEYQEIPLRHFVSENDLKQGNVSESITVKVPIGNSEIKTPVTIVTLVLSILGALAVLYFMLQSNKPKLD